MTGDSVCACVEVNITYTCAIFKIKGKRTGTYAMVEIKLHITQFSDWANPLAA